jgi:hypothetical protein
LLYVAVRNTGSAPLYVQFFDVGLSSAITLLNWSYPSGIEVPPDGEYVLGGSVGGQLKGLPLYWPKGVPEDGPREETVMVLVFDRPCEMGYVGQAGIRSRSLPVEQSRFWRAILSGRRTRDLGDPDLADVRYATDPITFALVASPA